MSIPRYRCRDCGKPIHDPPSKGNGRCRACHLAHKVKSNREAFEKKVQENPPLCVICGKEIPNWTRIKQRGGTKTCSRECTAKLIQSKIQRETKEEQLERILAGIREHGSYMTGEEIRKAFHVELGKKSKLGLTATQLNKLAGVPLRCVDWLSGYNLTKEQALKQFIDLLKEDRSLSSRAIAKKMGVTMAYLHKLGINGKDVRRSLGFFSGASKTKEELEAEIVAWLKTQPVYCSAVAVAKGMGIDYVSSIQKHQLDIPALNAQAGHYYDGGSYCENYTYAKICQAGLYAIRQKTFQDCRFTNVLRFDFYFPEYNVLLEVDGAQHYQPEFPNYADTHRNDLIKEAYAKDKGIALFRLKEVPLNTLDERLHQFIERLKGLPRVSEEVHTDSNCGELLPDTTEDNPQPSLEKESAQVESDFQEGSTTIPDGGVHIE